MTRTLRKLTGLASLGLALLASSGCSGLFDDFFWGRGLGRSAFVYELLVPQETPRTPGTYHVDKLDLLAGVRKARASGDGIVGMLVFGPTGPLCAYDVLVVVEAEDGQQLNSLLCARPDPGEGHP